MRVQNLRDIPGFGIGTQHQTPDPGSIAELCTVGPFLHLRRINVGVPPTPVIPGNEDRYLRPQTALNYGVHLADGPRHTVGDISHWRVRALVLRVGWMLAQSVRRVDPRNGRQLSCSGVLGELIRSKLRPLRQRLNQPKRIAAVIAPCETGGVEAGWQG